MNYELQARLETVVLNTYLKAQQVYGRTFVLPAISYRDMGRTAGKAFYYENRIVFSPTLYTENVETFLNRTVPHEIAHLITHVLYPHATMHHGDEWRSVMLKLEVKDIGRCHKYNTASTARTMKRYVYSCNCPGKTFKLSATLHNRIQGGEKRYCLRCKTLTFTGNFVTNKP